MLRPCLRGTVECRYHEREGRAWLRGGKATTPLYVHALIASACTLSDGGPATGSSAKVIPIRALPSNEDRSLSFIHSNNAPFPFPLRKGKGPHPYDE